MFRARVGVLLASTTAVLCLACGSSSGGADAGTSGGYGSYQIDPAHSGVISGGKLKPPLTQLWSPIPTPGGSTYPVVVNNTIYVVIFPTLGADIGLLHALNAKTGVDLWPPVNVANASALAVGDGIVVVTSTNSTVRAFKASTGTEIWSNVLPAGSSSFDVPIIANGIVYVNNDAGNVWAFSDVDGTLVWNSATAQSTVASSNGLEVGTGYITGPMAFADSLVVGQQNSAVNALDASSGKLTWTLQFGGGQAGWPLSINGSEAAVSVVSNGGGGEAAGGILVNVLGGKLSSNSVYFVSTRAPVSDATQRYAVDGTTGTLSATNLSSGTLAWTYFPSGDQALDASPLLVNGVIYTASGASGTLYAVSTSGKGLWSDSSLGWTDPAALLAVGSKQILTTLEWGSMGSDGNVLAVATTGAIAAYGNM
jgi:outer membrane protein assembly factor BamB